MSEALVLNGALAEGAARVREVAAPGMIALKADLSLPRLTETVRAATGCAMPQPRGIVSEGGAKIAWMAPDEVLIFVPRAQVSSKIDALQTALSDAHALVADVSDQRAVFRVEGGLAARETLAKLSPVDLAPGRFAPGEFRRTRLAQIAAAFWMEDDGIMVVCFRSVARYAFDLLRQAADVDARVGYFEAE